jgi:hypothetical protein
MVSGERGPIVGAVLSLSVGLILAAAPHGCLGNRHPIHMEPWPVPLARCDVPALWGCSWRADLGRLGSLVAGLRHGCLTDWPLSHFLSVSARLSGWRARPSFLPGTSTRFSTEQGIMPPRTDAGTGGSGVRRSFS